MSFLVDTPQAHLQCITICGYVISQFCLLVNRYTELLHIFSECYLIEPLPNLLKACASPISHGIIGNFCNFLLVIIGNLCNIWPILKRSFSTRPEIIHIPWFNKFFVKYKSFIGV